MRADGKSQATPSSPPELAEIGSRDQEDQDTMGKPSRQQGEGESDLQPKVLGVIRKPNPS